MTRLISGIKPIKKKKQEESRDLVILEIKSCSAISHSQLKLPIEWSLSGRETSCRYDYQWEWEDD